MNWGQFCPFCSQSIPEKIDKNLSQPLIAEFDSSSLTRSSRVHLLRTEVVWRDMAFIWTKSNIRSIWNILFLLPPWHRWNQWPVILLKQSQKNNRESGGTQLNTKLKEQANHMCSLGLGQLLINKRTFFSTFILLDALLHSSSRHDIKIFLKAIYVLASKKLL